MGQRRIDESTASTRRWFAGHLSEPEHLGSHALANFRWILILGRVRTPLPLNARSATVYFRVLTRRHGTPPRADSGSTRYHRSVSHKFSEREKMPIASEGPSAGVEHSRR